MRSRQVSLRSFLDQEVDVVDAERSELLVRALKVEEESTEGDVNLTVRAVSTCFLFRNCARLMFSISSPSLSSNPSLHSSPCSIFLSLDTRDGTKAGCYSHILSLTLLKSIHLSPTNVVKHICQRVLLCALFPPSLACFLFRAVQVQCRGQNNLHGFANGKGVDFMVDVEGEDGLGIGGCGCDAGDTVVFLVVEAREGEGVVEEGCVGHGCGGLTL